MPFPDRLLNEGEEVAVDVHPHWWYLAGPVAALVVVVAGAVAAAVLGAPTAVSLAVVAVMIVAIGWLGVRYLRWRTTSLVITSFRLIERRGILGKTGREIPLDHLCDISYRQRFFDRVIGAGDLLLESAGRDGQEVFPDLPHPATLQNEIYRQINRARQPPGYPPGGYGPNGAAPLPASGGPSIPEQIGQLDQLRRQGIISQTEFDAKKAELLNRL